MFGKINILVLQDVSYLLAHVKVTGFKFGVKGLCRVKSGNFGHQVHVYLDIHLQTLEIQMRRLIMSIHMLLDIYEQEYFLTYFS